MASHLEHQSESARQLTLLWMRAQPIVAAFIASAIRDTHHAEDVLQEVAETVATQFAEFDRTRSFLPWAMGIARNKVHEHLRSQSKDRLVFGPEVLERIAEAHEKVEPEWDDMRHALRRCIKGLRPRPREILEMHYLRQMKASDIAKLMGVKRNALFVALHRTRQALGECIRQRLAAEGETP